MEEIKFPFLEHVGAKLVFAKDGTATTKIDIESYHLQHLGFVHGGVISTLLDNTGWYAVMSSLDEDHTCVTMQINIDYLKTSTKQKLTCTGKVIQPGKRKSFAQIQIYDEQNRVIAHATGNYAILKNEPLK